LLSLISVEQKSTDPDLIAYEVVHPVR
jgi:hypothetical protein